MSAPFDKEAPSSLRVVTLRTEPDLPGHVLGDSIQWETSDGLATARYYLDDPDNNDFRLVEFIEDHWHYIHRHQDAYLTSLDDIIPVYRKGTGFWRHTDPQHPRYHLPSEAGPSTSVVDISASGDPPTLPEIHTRPIFTPGPDSDSDHSPTPEDKEERDPLDAELPYRVATPEEQLQERILAAQFENVLDIRQRVIENPATPEYPAYLNLIEEAIVVGVNVPPPPPLAKDEPAPFFQPLVITPPPIVMANILPQQQQPAAPAPLMGKLHGETPDVFNGDHKKSEVFLQQFNVHWGLNDNHKIMMMPYL